MLACLNRRSIALIASLLLSSAPVFAASMLGLEWDVETDTATTTLPVVVPSTMLARTCPTCKSVQLQVSADTQFFIGKQTVSLQELRKAAAQGRQFMMVFYKRETPVVTRIVIYSGNLISK